MDGLKMVKCQFRKKHKRVQNNSVCTAYNVDSWLEECGEEYIACELHVKRFIAGSWVGQVEYHNCIGPYKCPIYNNKCKGRCKCQPLKKQKMKQEIQ